LGRRCGRGSPGDNRIFEERWGKNKQAKGLIGTSKTRYGLEKILYFIPYG